MSDDVKLGLVKKFLELESREKVFVIVGSITLFSFGATAHNYYTKYQKDKLALEQAQLQGEVDRLRQLQPKEDETVVKTVMYETLVDRPASCPSVPSDQIAASEKQKLVDKSYIQELERRPAFCPSLPTDPHPLPLAEDQPTHRTCLDPGDPIELSAQFEEYNSRQNEKLFRDHFEHKWVCDPGWIVEITANAERNRDYYWEVSTTFRGTDLIGKSVLIKLAEGPSLPAWIKVGNKIQVTGKVVRANRYSFTLVEATTNLAE